MKKQTTEEFTARANKIHKYKYDYSKVIYEHKDEKIQIICPVHGEFSQIANSHVRGYGCKKCSVFGISPKGKDKFIDEAKKVHGDTYDYSLVNYINNNTKVKIICSKHGIFEQSSKNHIINKNRCPKCSMSEVGESKKPKLTELIKSFRKIHKNKYDYSKVNYINSHVKISILCPMHGEFKQKPMAHLQLKQGCPKCFNDIRKFNAPSWKVDGWINAANKSKNFDNFKLYVIKCKNDNEEFIKIGRTYNELKTRFSQIPYDYEIIRLITSSDAKYIYELERRFKSLYKNKKYIPKNKFGGMYECFLP